MSIGITEKEQNIIIDILKEYKDYSFYFYGSRIKGTWEKTSDLDILIKGRQEVPLYIIDDLKQKFDDSNLPYIVNFSDYYLINKDFYKRIEKDLFPYDWKECKIDDICKMNEQTYSNNENWEYVNYLDTGNITLNKIDNIQYIDLSIDKLPSRARRKVQNSDIIYSTVRPNQLHYGLIKKQPQNFLVSTGFAVLNIDKAKAVPEYIYYTLTQNSYTEALHSIAEQSTSAYPSIKPSDIGSREIILPPLETQQKIAKVLGAIDDKIELNNSINKNLEQQIKSIYSNSFNNSNNLIDISDLIDIRDGTHDSPKPQKEGKKLITSKHLLKYGVDISSANLISETDYEKINERSRVETNDILISMIGTVGIVSYIIENPVDFAVKNVGIYRTSQKLEYSYYIHCYLNSSDTQNYILSHLAGTTQKYISLSELRTLKVNIPNQSELEKFNKLVKPMYDNIINLTKENERLTQLRDTLLPKLMNGEIDVDKVEV